MKKQFASSVSTLLVIAASRSLRSSIQLHAGLQ